MRVWAAKLTLPAPQELWERKLLGSKSPEEAKQGGENDMEGNQPKEMNAWNLRSQVVQWGGDIQSLG